MLRNSSEAKQEASERIHQSGPRGGVRSSTKMNSVIEAATSKISKASAIPPVAKRLRYVRSKEDVKALLR
jgi:uncharacterized protein YoaH (UPF0181 family)